MNTSQLTFTRFIAAIAIVIFHFGNRTFPFNSILLHPIISHANLGVSYFFILSGFVMMLAYGNKDKLNAKNYIMKRGARIAPVYYLALLMMFVYFFIRLKILKVPFIYAPNITDTLLNLTFLQAWIPEKAQTINTAAWSLSVEALFYISFPFLFNHLVKKYNNKHILMTAILFFVFSQVLFHYFIKHFTNPLYYYFQPLFHLNEFVMGIAVGKIAIANHKQHNNFLPLIGITTLIILSLYFPIKGLQYHNGMMAILFCPFIFLLTKDKSIISTIFTHKKLIWLGEISYSIYILQFPVFYFFTATISFFGFEYQQSWFFYYLVILIIVSGICYEMVEKPMRRRIVRSIGQ